MTHSITYRRMLTRMSYYNYQNGLILHHVKQKGGWAGHQEHCRNFIIRALDFHKPEKVTVLGSGWLLELPFAELAERAGKVRLIDIIHPPDVISQVADYKNVELIEQDVTGGLIAEVWQKTRKYSFLNRLKSLDKIVIPEFKQDDDPGLVISINILTQLESLLLNFIKKRSKIGEEEFTVFRSEIQRKHLDFLRKNNAVLITDYAEVFSDRSGNITTLPTLLTDLPSYRLREEWTWNFDLTGADLYNKRSQFKIVALIS